MDNDAISNNEFKQQEQQAEDEDDEDDGDDGDPTSSVDIDNEENVEDQNYQVTFNCLLSLHIFWKCIFVMMSNYSE